MTACSSLGFLVAVLALTVCVDKSYAFCGVSDYQYHDIPEANQIIHQICTAQRGSGATVRLKSGILVFPDPFFVRVPWNLSISLGLPTVIDNSEMRAWEFGGIQIGSEDDETFDTERVNSSAVEHPVIDWAAAQCKESISLSRGFTEHPIVGSKRDVYILSVQEHRIRAVGDVQALMFALIDSYIRLNCKG